MRWGAEKDSEPVQAFKERSMLLAENGAPLAMLARGAQPPGIQLMYFGAAPLHQGAATPFSCVFPFVALSFPFVALSAHLWPHMHPTRPLSDCLACLVASPNLVLFTPFMLSLGEAFDVACFGGVTAYHATRVEGGVAAAVLSSIHIRCVDMEMSCQPKVSSDKVEFEKNTRAASTSLMLWMGANLASDDCSKWWCCGVGQHARGDQSRAPNWGRAPTATLCHLVNPSFLPS